jgi:hypothetical protein
LKARAHRELFERRESGDKTAEEKAIQKYLKDIWRLSVVLTGEETIALTGQPEKDVTSAIQKLGLLPKMQFKQVMENIPGVEMEAIMAVLKKVFLKS